MKETPLLFSHRSRAYQIILIFATQPEKVGEERTDAIIAKSLLFMK
jgi:hypothetical protein